MLSEILGYSHLLATVTDIVSNLHVSDSYFIFVSEGFHEDLCNWRSTNVHVEESKSATRIPRHDRCTGNI